MLHDVFICHASEDKNSIVRVLAKKLKSQNIDVWYDEFSLKLGDSIRRSLDKGLKQSRFGIVILSNAFFDKKWTQYELDSLIEREMAGNDTLILPVWHNISHKEILTYSPALAGRKAVSSETGIDNVVKEILSVVQPDYSPLIIARDFLINKGFTPPVITDSWWLNIIELSSGYYEDFYSWIFPIPQKRDNEIQWGESIAWTALQINWSESSEEQRITTISNPIDILNFIKSEPGLKEICTEYIGILGEWAPQLIIPGFGEEFEPFFQHEYEASCREYDNGKGRPGKKCKRKWCFRHPKFGLYKPSDIGYKFFRGSRVPKSPYHDIDHAFWLLSDLSSWLPERIRAFLIEGLASWITWPWGSYCVNRDIVESHERWPSYGELSKTMFLASEGKKFRINKNVKQDLLERIKYSKIKIGIKEPIEVIEERFHKSNFINNYISIEKERIKRRNK